jgi:signal transduction histidine kinase
MYPCSHQCAFPLLIVAACKTERLFEQFYRVCSEKDQTYSGLSIGLHIAYEIIR